MKIKSVLLALSLTLSAGGFAVAAPISPPAPIVLAQATFVSPTQSDIRLMRAALASYHDIDASYSDVLHMAALEPFRTAIPAFGLPATLLTDAGDFDANDRETMRRPAFRGGIGNSGEPGAAAPDGGSLSGDHGGISNDWEDFGSTSEGTPSSAGNDNFLLGLGYDFAEDGSGQDPTRRDYVADDTRLAMDFDDREALMPDSGVMIAAIEATARMMGSATISDANQFALGIGSRLDQSQGLQTLKSRAGFESESTPDKMNVPLPRLSGRDFETRVGVLSEAQQAPFFTARLLGDDSLRTVMLSASAGEQGTERQMFIQERGSDFIRVSSRVFTPMANGSTLTSSSMVTELADGTAYQILEERLSDATGTGTGRGLITIKELDGRVTQGMIKTLRRPDGSLISLLEAGDSRTVIFEDAGGNALMALTPDSEEWKRLDFGRQSQGLPILP